MKTLKRIFPKLFPILGLIYFGWSAFGAPRGVSYDSATTNVYQITHQTFHSITNLASTAGEIALHNAEEKLVSTNAAGVRGMLSVPVFDLTDPGAVNIFPFWDDTGNEVDWTSNTALRTLLGIDSNDAVTFGAITGDSFTAGSTNVIGALDGKQPLDPDLTALAAIAGAQGAIIYHNGTSWVKLDPGTSGHVLKTQGAGANPQWAAESGGGGGSAPVGTMVNSGASTQYAIPYYDDATGTNMVPSLITTDSTKTNLNVGAVNANVVVVTNLAQSLSNLGLGTGNSPQFTAVEVGHASDSTLARGGAGYLTVEGVEIVMPASTNTLTQKTFDAAGSGNVLKFIEWLPFVYPAAVDGAGATITTNNYTSLIGGLATFSGNAETNANFAWYYAGIVPRDIDTSVELVLKDFNIAVSGTDTDAATFHIAFYQPSGSGAAFPTSWASASTPIEFSTGALTSAAANDAFFVNDVTLTGWAAGLTAGRPLIIGVARAQNTSDDSIYVTSASLQWTRTK